MILPIEAVLLPGLAFMKKYARKNTSMIFLLQAATLRYLALLYRMILGTNSGMKMI